MGKKPLSFEEFSANLSKNKPATITPPGGKKMVAPTSDQPPVAQPDVSSYLTSIPPMGKPFTQVADLAARDNAPAPEQDNNELLYKSIIAAVPTLIGAAFGNRGGELGAAAGAKGIADYDANEAQQKAYKASAEDKLFERGVKTQTMANQARMLNIKDREVGVKADAVRGQKGAAQTKELKDFQEKFNSDPTVKTSRQAMTHLPGLRELLNRGTGQDFKAAQFKLATIFNGSRPTDADVKAFSGSQQLWDQIESYAKMKANDQITDAAKKDLLLLINTMDQEAARNLETAADYRVGQAEKRGLGKREQLMEALNLSPLQEEKKREPGTDDDAAKDAEINRILGLE